MQLPYRILFDKNIKDLFHNAGIVSKHDPRQFLFFSRMAVYQSRAAAIRRKNLKRGLEVPPLLIVSITKRCNLKCTGCYSRLLHTSPERDLERERFGEILAEAAELGVSIIMLAGGEPLVRREILETAAAFGKVIFPVFTNGTLLDKDYLSLFIQNPHLIPVISLEGRELETDARRGDGVYQNFLGLAPAMCQSGIFWGVSLTITSATWELQLSEHFLKEYIDLGCRLFFFVEYVPVASGSEDLVLSDEQKEALPGRIDALCKRFPGLFIAFPGDEVQYGGCLAAGRGFLHVNPSGEVEACPFAPYSDTSLRTHTLREALSSPLLQKIRENHDLLQEGKGGCALWANRDFVQKRLSKS
jgi:MoaA/NifB/PqqE/SkfB family radical SAM enzyme